MAAPTTANPLYDPGMWEAVYLLAYGSTTPVIIPSAQVLSNYALNKMRPDLMNATSYPTVEISGKFTPSLRIIAPAKASWFYASLINSAIVQAGANGGQGTPSGGTMYTSNLEQTVAYAIKLQSKAGSGFDAYYLVCRMASMRIVRQAAGGGVAVTMDFVVLAGEQDAVGAWSASTLNPYLAVYGAGFLGSPADYYYDGTNPFSGLSFPGTSYGQAYGVTSCGFADGGTMTADMIRSFDMTIMRDQALVPYDNQTPWCPEIATGYLRAQFALEQSNTANYAPNFPAAGDNLPFYINIGELNNPSSNSYVQFSWGCSLNGFMRSDSGMPRRILHSQFGIDIYNSQGGYPLLVTQEG